MHIGGRARLGATHVEVTRLGLGTASMGGWPEEQSEADAIAAVRASWDAGVRYFDTAPLYGYGQAETFLARGLAGYSHDDYSVLSKVGKLLRPLAPGEADPNVMYKTHERSLRPVDDYSADGVRRAVEASLARLGVERIDIALIHDPQDRVDEVVEQTYPGLIRLKEEGLVGAIGVGINYGAPLAEIMRRVDLDCALIAMRYSLLDQAALEEALPTALERGVSIIAGTVLASGILADPSDGARFNYGIASDGVLTRARAMARVCEHYGVPLAAAALQFPFGHPAVVSVVVGAQTAEQARQNAEHFSVDIPDACWRDLKSEGLLPADVPVPAAD